jgi:uncharacterized membrane protein YeaQ/YmgE (transglycosylase-associated protein family)
VTVEGVLTAIVVGAVIGALGRLVLPGKQPIGWLLTIVVGIVAATLGTFLARALGIDTEGFRFLELVVQVVLAVIGVAIVAGAFRGRPLKPVRHPLSPSSPRPRGPVGTCRPGLPTSWAGKARSA